MTSKGIEIKKKEEITWDIFHKLDSKIFEDNTIQQESFVDLKKQGLYFLFIDGKAEPIGYLSFKIFGTEGQISRHGILPDYRKQGFGQILLDFALKKLKKKGCYEAFVYILEDYVPGLILYSSYGFEKIKAVYQFKIDYDTLNNIEKDLAGFTVKELDINEIKPFIIKYDALKEKIESYFHAEERNIVIGFYKDDKIRGFGRFTPTYPGLFPLFISYPKTIYSFLELTRAKWALQKYDYMYITFEDQVTVYKELKKNFKNIKQSSLLKKELY